MESNLIDKFECVMHWDNIPVLLLYIFKTLSSEDSGTHTKTETKIISNWNSSW